MRQDCDNGFSVDFVKSVVDYLREGNMTKFIFWKGDDGGVTGRMGYWEETFRKINGYDEDMKGNGSEDIDLKYRYNQLRSTYGKWVVTERGLVFKEHQWRRCNAGWSVCNDIDGDVKKGLAESKMLHVAPEVGQGKSWGQHNGANWKKVQNKTSPFRNEGRAFHELGMPFKEWFLDDSPETRSDVVLLPRSDVVLRPRKLTWGRMSEALSLDANKFPGLANASAETTVSFVSFGIGLAELLWGNPSDVDDMMELGKSCANRIELATAMMMKKGIIKHDAIVRPIRSMWWSTFLVRRDLREHTGMHADHIHSMVRALSKEPQRLKEWMMTISKAVERGGGGDVIVLCYDELMGRRASSIAIVLQHLLEASSTKAKIGDVTHLSRPLWSDRMCGPCAACTSQSSARSASLDVVRKLWQNMAPI